jgi:preprotein translocase subunit SecG
MLYYLVATLYVLTSFLLILVVLLQQGKGGDIANAFGGGASQAAFGARSGATVLSRATTVLAALFVVGAIVLGIMGQRGPGSVLGGRTQSGAPAPSATTTPAPAPKPGSTPVPVSPAPAAPATPAPATPAPAPAPAPQ